MISMWQGPTGLRIGIGSAIEYVYDRRARVEIYAEPRDWWIGAYVAENAIYVCPVPCLVFRFSRGRSIVS